MKQLTPVPSESADRLKHENETGIGYQVVAVLLKDGRRFDQAVASEGCIIQVRGYKELPFTPSEVKTVTINHKRWNFRNWSDAGTRRKSRAASA